MIIPFDKIDDIDYSFGGSVFQGKVQAEPWKDWQSQVPDISELVSASQIDKKFADDLEGLAKDIIEGTEGSREKISQYISERAIMDWVDGTRQTLGVVAQTAGIIGKDILAVKEIFTGDEKGIAKAFEITDAVIGTAAFQAAINAIGIIPVVGWVIKAVYEVAKTVTDIIIAVQNKKTAEARGDLAKELTIPFGIIDYSSEGNTKVTRDFFGHIKSNNSDEIIRPSFGFDGPGGAFNAEKVVGGPNVGSGMSSGWIVDGSSVEDGYGYVPGTSSMTRSIYFPASLNSGGGCKAVSSRDIASLYPSAQNICSGWWSQVNTPGASMFSVQPRASKVLWENYIERMFALAEDLLKGWSCAPTGKAFTNKFRCLKDEPDLWDHTSTGGMGGCGERGKPTSGDLMTIPSDFGRAAHTGFYGYLCQLYFGLARPFDTKKGGLSRLPRVHEFTYQNDLGNDFYRANALDLSKSVPVSALETLYINQRATLKSIQCMYVSGEDDNHGNRDRFPAFNDHTLRTLWRDSVTDVFASGSWRRVSYQDMPEGEAKSQFKQLALSKGIQDVENFNRPCAPGENPRTSDCGFKASMKLSAGYQMPDNPTLPTAPTMNGAVLQATIARTQRRPGGSTKKKSSALPLVLGAGAIALLMMRGRK